MINYTTLENSIYTIVQPILNITTIFARQSDPAPSTLTDPYATILLNNLVQVGRERLGETTGAGLTPVSEDYVLTIDFQVYGPGARTKAQALRSAFNRPTVSLSFLAVGLAIVEQPVVLDIPTIRNTSWEESALVTVTFHLADTNNDDTGFIETVEDMVGNYLDAAGNTVLQTTTTIDAS